VIHSRENSDRPDSNGPCTATLVGPSTAITAAHCTQVDKNDPLVLLFRVRGVWTQYIAESITRHPLFVANSSMHIASGDIAIIRLNKEVPTGPDGIEPIRLLPGSPTFGYRMSVVGFDEWVPLTKADPVKRVFDTFVGDISDNEDTFEYDQTYSSSCLQGGAGSLVLGSDSDGRQYILGIQSYDNEVLRLDNYACWVACDDAAGLPSELIPSSCDCQPTGGERCGECGVLDDGVCVSAEDRFPCSEGLTCNTEGRCVVAAECSVKCTDIDGNSICEGDMGNRVCPTDGTKRQTCTCGSDGLLDDSCGACM
jgi:hypothetical protein